MALQHRVVSLPALGSVDERTDSDLVRHPRLAQNRNVNLEKGRGSIRKRLRFTAVSGGAPMFERGSVFGSIDLTMLCQTRKRVLRADGPTLHLWCDIAYGTDGYIFVSYMRYNSAFTDYEWRVACLDAETYEQQNDWDEETPLSTPTGAGAPAYVCGRDDSVVAIWADGSDIKVSQTTSPTSAFSTPSTIVSGTYSKALAVCQEGSTYAWITYTDTSNDVKVFRLTLSTLTGSNQLTLAAYNAEPLDIVYSTIHDDVYVAGCSSVNGTFVASVGGAATRVLDATHTSSVTNIAVGETIRNNRIVVIYTDENGTALEPRLEMYGCPSDLSSVAVSHEVMGSYLASKILYYNSLPVFVVGWASQGGNFTSGPGTRFLCTIERVSGQGFRMEPIAALGQGIARIQDVSDHLPKIVTDGSDQLYGVFNNYIAPKTFDGLFSAIAGAAVNCDVSLYNFDFRTHRIANNLEAHGMQVIAGGLPMMFDGIDYETLGPLHQPEIFDTTLSTEGGSAALAAGTYQYVAVYEMFDAQGRVWRSAPSLPVTVTNTSDDTCTLDVYVAVARVKGNSRYPIRVIVYRTQDSGDIFYRVVKHVINGTAVVDADWNIQSEPWVSIADDFADADIDENEQLYTTGGVLEDAPAPPCVAFEVHRRRLWAIDSETGNVWYSKLFVPGEGVRFTLSFQVQNPFPHEIPTALVSTESSLLVFYESRIAQVFGDGPDDLGLSGQFSEMEFLPTQGIGAISQRLTAATPQGVFFLDTNHGPMLLPYGGTPQPIGNDSWPYVGNFSTAYSEATHRGVDWLEDRNEVRFVEVDGDWWAYHVEQQVWSQGTSNISGGEVLQSLVSEGRFHVLANTTSAHAIEATSIGAYLNANNVQVYETGWITLASLPGIQGMYRLWDIYFLGDLLNCRITLSYDWDSTDTYEVLVGSLGGSATRDPEQVRVQPSKQRIQALKIKIEEGTISGGVFTLTSTTSGFDLSEIQLHFGVPTGHGRKPWLTVNEPGGGA